jgi:Uma2 family endonuclease
MPNDTSLGMPVQDFLSWNPGDGRAWQLVDGEPQAMAPANRTHGTFLGELGAMIGNHLLDRASRCSVVMLPGIVPHVRATYNMRVPDLAVTCSDYDVEGTALTDPVLIAEILSPNNQAETWANVWAYATIPSVREILVLRAVTVGADLLRRGPDGSWPREPDVTTNGDLVLESIGLRTPLADLYRSTRLRPSSQT